jgi:4-alpha-glucanotransferase
MSGVLLHPTSLPGRFGVGDLGPEATRFVDFLAASGQSLWQILPLGPPSIANSPYQGLSASAGNALLISPERLVEDGLLAPDDIARPPEFSLARVDFGDAIAFKTALLRKACSQFRTQARHELREDYDRFCARSGGWLEDYALFRALKEQYGGRSWLAWQDELKRREPGALAAARSSLAAAIEDYKCAQFLFFRQWQALRAYATARKIQILGDMPIFVAGDSSDVWAHPELFKLDANLQPVVVAGVPPDAFSETGQLWGNPLYDWGRMRATGFQWWIDRLRATLELVDIVRVDHFRGFAACWEIPATDKTAQRGRWVPVPGREVFLRLREVLGTTPILAEDLGVITPDVVALRDEFEFPGMRVLQFAFDDDAHNPHLPHHHVPNCAVYTGTHDNDTTMGWYHGSPGVGITLRPEQLQYRQHHCRVYLNTDGHEIHWDLIRCALSSVAALAVVPAQDLLGLDSTARMNVPAVKDGNWSWRLEPGALTPEIGTRLRDLTELFGRRR